MRGPCDLISSWKVAIPQEHSQANCEAIRPNCFRGFAKETHVFRELDPAAKVKAFSDWPNPGGKCTEQGVFIDVEDAQEV